MSDIIKHGNSNTVYYDNKKVVLQKNKGFQDILEDKPIGK